MGLLAEACSMQVEIGGPRGPVVVANTERWQSSLKANFTNAILAALIPLVAFAVFVIVYENRRARSEIEDTVFDASRRLTEAIDAELRHQLGALSTLALSIDLDEQPNFRGFYEEARRAASQHPGWFAVNLVEPQSARPILHTMRPFGELLPPVGLPEDYADVARMRRPLIAGRIGRSGAVVQQPFITLRVPVLRDDEVRYVLSAALSLGSVQALMVEQLDRELPRVTRPAAGAAILDSEGRFVARLVEPEKFAGQLASEQTRANMRLGPGVYEGRTIDGLETYGAYTQSGLTGWTTVVGIRRADADALSMRSFWAVLGGGIVSIVLAGLLALQLGREATRRRNERECLLLLEADQRLLAQAKQSVAEKETLLREIHHRLKNNMQTIISLLRTSASQWPDEYRDTIRTAVRRMIAMVNVHEQLYRSPELAKLALGPYLDSIMRDVAIAEGAAARRIGFRVQADEIWIDLNRALPVGLIMTECLINIFKHAFPDRRVGEITVALSQSDGTARLSVRDDGVGVPASLGSTRASLGFELIETLACQIGGRTRTGKLERGTETIVEFPIEARRQLGADQAAQEDISSRIRAPGMKNPGVIRNDPG
jgi:two-component sensor histidine kinase